jgi:1-phosphatidylinositol phosphodiesterase
VSQKHYGLECELTATQRYSIPSFLSIPEKMALSTQNLIMPPVEPTIPTLAISFFSASSFPLALPTTIARGVGWSGVGFGFEGVNRRVGSWLLEILSASGTRGEKAEASAPKIRGWTFMDFYDDPVDQGVVPLLVECNFRGN